MELDSALDIEAKAIRLLAMREHSRSELASKLSSASSNSNVIEQVLDDLVRRNLLSDERFAEQYVEMRIRKGYGPLRIRSELEQRGISSNLISLYLDEIGADWRAILRDVATSKFGHQVADTPKQQAKQARFLEYRGFPVSIIRSWLWDSSSEADYLD